MSFWAIALLPGKFSLTCLICGGGDPARLLPQNIAKSMRVEKEVEARAVLRAGLQILESGLERHVADDAGQAPRQIRRVLVRQQSGGDRGGAPQLHQRY